MMNVKKNTSVLMYDGSLKKVQDIKTRDTLMSNESKPITVKKGRPFTTKIPRTMVRLNVALREGAIQDLLDHYDTDNQSEAARKAIYEVLGIEEELVETFDTNKSRRNKKAKTD